jgi:hypothetical protein
VLLQEKHTEHAAIVGPLVRPLIERNAIPLDATNLSSTQHSIDVVLTTYNAADQINFSIRNALSQSVPPKKIIVVDANSSDHTAQMVQRIYAQEPKVRLISCPNAQIWQARQLGIAQSDSTYIAFLNCTPENHPKWNTNYLEQQLAHLSKNPGAIGSLGTITLAPQDEPQRNDCLINLPSAGCASNLLLIRNECTTNALLEDQLRLAEQHGQWQLLEALFSLAQAPNAKVITSQLAQTDEAIANEKILQILTWWSAYPQLILTQTQLLTLIRHAFIGAIGSTQPSLLTHLAIFNHRYQLFKPALNQDIFVRACISYLNMAGEVIKTHYQKQYSAIKTQIARLPLANKVHQALCR